VSGNTIQVTERNSTATIAFTNQTAVAEMDPAQPSDVTVVVSPAGNGQCPQSQGGRGVRGMVASVTGTTVAVTTEGNSNPTTVRINGNTRYVKRVTADSQAIAAGKCVMARGTEDNSGALEATSISVRQAGNRPCPSPKR
jgi:hypothetical protein